MNSFRSLSLSYKTASLEVRELFALNELEIKVLYSKIKDLLKIQELLIVSTCNRTELYYVAPQPLTLELIKIIGIEKQIQDPEKYQKHFLTLLNQAAVRHLFYVSIGLEAQVVGDVQIINQIKNAYQWSADADMSGPYLHRLLHTIFYCNKKVINQTVFKDGSASVTSATLEIIETLVPDSTVKILIVGLGEIGQDLCSSFEKSRFTNITICNRTLSRTEKFATSGIFEIAPFAQVREAINQADIIISSVSKPQPLITSANFDNNTLLTHKYLFDLSVPRSIATDVEEINGIVLYNIDDIQVKADAVLRHRMEAIPLVKAIIEGSVLEFENWQKEISIGPTLQKIKDALEHIRHQEFSRFSKQMKQDQQELMETLTKNMMQKILKLPALQLKAACQRGEAETLIATLHSLFGLETMSHKSETSSPKTLKQISTSVNANI